VRVVPEERALSGPHGVVRRLTHRRGANFSLGFRLLPKPKRRAVYAAYAACRIPDDIVDEAGGRPAAEVRDRLDAWEREVVATYEGRPSLSETRALADVLRDVPVPRTALLGLIDGCRMDLERRSYATFADSALPAGNSDGLSLSRSSERSVPGASSVATRRRCSRLTSAAMSADVKARPDLPAARRLAAHGVAPADSARRDRTRTGADGVSAPRTRHSARLGAAGRSPVQPAVQVLGGFIDGVSTGRGRRSPPTARRAAPAGTRRRGSCGVAGAPFVR
jgi:hypothetical protein